MKNLKNFLVAGVLLFSLSGHAQSAEPVSNGNDFELKLIRIEDNYLYFQLGFSKMDATFSSIRISDKEEGDLYENAIRMTTGPTTFKIERRDGQVLVFTLKIDNKLYSKQFSIQTVITEKAEFSENLIVKG